MLLPLVGRYFLSILRDQPTRFEKLAIVRLEPRTFGVRGFQSANSDTLRMSTTVLHWPRLLFRVISRIQGYFSLSILFWIGRWTQTKNLKSGFFSFKLASSSSSSDKIFSFSGGVESKTGFQSSMASQAQLEKTIFCFDLQDFASDYWE